MNIGLAERWKRYRYVNRHHFDLVGPFHEIIAEKAFYAGAEAALNEMLDDRFVEKVEAEIAAFKKGTR